VLLLAAANDKSELAEKTLHYVQQSMHYEQLSEIIKGQKKEIAQIQNKPEFVFNRTPREPCQKYILLDQQRKTAVNKKRKEIEREIAELEDAFRYIKEDCLQEKKKLDHETDIETRQNTLVTMESKIAQDINSVIQILEQNGFLAEPLLTLASQLNEMHPLVLTDLEGMTTKELVGLFSCFTDVRVETQTTRRVYGGVLDKVLDKVQENLVRYETLETEKNINTGIEYKDYLQFDLMDVAMEWVDCQDELACKTLIQIKVSTERGISVGDFTKALLKIVAIANEWIQVYEKGEEKIEVLQNLKGIEPAVLKYVVTNQSLYL
jgi:hypothetical protein